MTAGSSKYFLLLSGAQHRQVLTFKIDADFLIFPLLCPKLSFVPADWQQSHVPSATVLSL